MENEEEEIEVVMEEVLRFDFGEYEVRYHPLMREWVAFHEEYEEGVALYTEKEEGEVEDIQESYSLFDGKVVIPGDTLRSMRMTVNAVLAGKPLTDVEESQPVV